MDILNSMIKNENTVQYKNYLNNNFVSGSKIMNTNQSN